MGQNFESKVRYSLVSMRYNSVNWTEWNEQGQQRILSPTPSPTSRRQLGKRERLETWLEQVHKLRWSKFFLY